MFGKIVCVPFSFDAASFNSIFVTVHQFLNVSINNNNLAIKCLIVSVESPLEALGLSAALEWLILTHTNKKRNQ